MLNVLVIGATGYIGDGAAHEMYRAGNHEVFGLAGTASEGYRLQRDEINPAVGSIKDADSVYDLIEEYNIHVIVDTYSFNETKTKPALFEAIKAAGARLLNESKRAKPQKLGFVTISGIWTHGTSEDPYAQFKVGEAGSLLSTDPSPDLLPAKSLYEESILSSTDILDIAILRPAMVFARGGSAWTRVLSPLVAARTDQPATITVPVTPGTFFNFVHVDDVATAISLAVDRIHLFNGTSVEPVFDLVSDRFDLRDLLVADARIFGCEGTVEQVKSRDESGRDGGDVFCERIGRRDDMDSKKAEIVLGWVPRRPGFVAKTHIYANSFLAGLKIAEEEREREARKVRG